MAHSGDTTDRDAVGRLALARDWVTEAQLDAALSHATSGVTLAQALLRKGLIDASQMVELLRAQRDEAPTAAAAADGATPGPAAVAPGARLGRYRIVSELGRGGMGVVLLAEDPDLRRQVALKVLDGRLASASLVARMQREAQLAAQLQHPGIVTVLDVGQAGGLHYIAMEVVDGGSLDGRRPRRRPLAEALQLTEGVARALHHAHAHGVVHRDVKLANVLLGDDGRPLITDFGLARSMEDTTRLTATGAVLGTPASMAPEQVLGRSDQIGPATDIWGLGVMLYELVSGRRPFRGRTPAQLYRQIVEDAPKPLEGPAWAVAARALAKVPEQRYASALAMADDLRALQEGRTTQARRPSALAGLVGWARGHRALSAAGVGLVVLAGLLLWMVPRLRTADAQRATAQRELARQRDADRARERQVAEQARQARSLEQLGQLWTQVVLAKQWIYQAHRTPAQIRTALEDATADVSAYLERHPRQPQGYFVRARARLSLGELEAAEADLRKALEARLDFAPGWGLLGTVLLSRYQLILSMRQSPVQRSKREALVHEARMAFDRAGADPAGQLERWGLVRTREDDVGAIVLEALRAHHVDGDRAAAIARLKAAHAAAPSEVYCLWIGSLSPRASDRLDWQARALQIAPHHALARFMRSTQHLAAGRHALAIADLDHCLQLHPRFVNALSERGAAHFRSRDWTRALADADRALALGGAQAMRLTNRGAVLLELGRAAEAVPAFRRAIELAPEHVEAHFGLAQVCMGTGRLEQALPHLDRTIALSPDHARALNNRGWIFFLRKDYARAFTDVDRAVRHEPSLPEGWDSRAQILLAQGKLDRALADATQAIRLRGTYYQAWMTRGTILERKGDDRGALEAYLQALKHSPRSWRARRELHARAKAARARLGGD